MLEAVYTDTGHSERQYLSCVVGGILAAMAFDPYQDKRDFADWLKLLISWPYNRDIILCYQMSPM